MDELKEIYDKRYLGNYRKNLGGYELARWVALEHFRSHLFSFVCTKLFRGPLWKLGEKMMLLDYSLFRLLPNGASMIGFAIKRST